MSLQEYFNVFFYYKGISLKVAFQNEKHFEIYRHNTVTERCSDPRNSSQLDIKELDALYDQIVDYTNKKKEFRLLNSRPLSTIMDKMWGTERVNNTYLWMDKIICLAEKAGFGFDICHYRYYSSDPKLSEEYTNAIEKKNRLEHCPICQLKSTNHCATCHQGYCGKDHQKKDWEVHKTNCKKIPKIPYSNNVYDNNKNYEL